MFTINIPIDDYIDKTFKINEEKNIILPKKINDDKKSINLTISFEENNEKNEILNALSDGFVNGYIESHKDITKSLLKLNYSYDDIKDITELSFESIQKIENEL